MQHETGETEENHKTGRGMQNGIFDRVIEDMKKDRSDKYHQTITYLCFWMDWKNNGQNGSSKKFSGLNLLPEEDECPAPWP